MKVILHRSIILNGKRYDKGNFDIPEEDTNNWFIKELIDQQLIVLVQDEVVTNETSDVVKSEVVKRGTAEVLSKKSRSKDSDGI